MANFLAILSGGGVILLIVEHAVASLQAGKNTLYDPNVVDVCLRIFRNRQFDFSPYQKAA